jgi:hypothetical protein
MILEIIIGSVCAFLVLIGFKEWTSWREKGGKPTDAVEAIKSKFIKEEKSEYLPPMNDEEYYAYQDKISGRSDLEESIEQSAPWNTDHQTSQSSDS